MWPVEKSVNYRYNISSTCIGSGMDLLHSIGIMVGIG